MNGVADGALHNNANFISFQGDFMDNHSQNTPSNQVYDMISQNALDGLVIWASSYIGRMGFEQTLAFCERFRPLPIVSIGVALPGIPGILINSYEAMRTALTHLIVDHHYRRIAFIQGALGHFDSEERFRAYCDILSEYGLPYDPALVSDYGQWDARRIPGDVRYLLDEQKACPDAWVAPSDHLAGAVIKELQRRGIQVPQDTAVIGINNEPGGRVISPPLTTSTICVYERAYQAVLTLFQMLAGNPVPHQQTLSSTLILRRSCGCISPELKLANLTAQAQPIITAVPPNVDERLSQRPILVNQLLALFPHTSPQRRAQLECLVDAFESNLKNQLTQVFIQRLEQCLNESAPSELELRQWQTLISTMRHLLTPLLDSDERSKAAGLWYQAAQTLTAFTERQLSARQAETAERNWAIHRFTQRLNSSFELPQLLEVIAEYLLKQGFGAFYLSLYENTDPRPQVARLILAYAQGQPLVLDASTPVFELPALLPPGILNPEQCHSLILIPLFYDTCHLGFILLERRPFFMSGIVYSSFQMQLSNALWRTRLFIKQKQTEQALREHTQNLLRSNSELQQFAYVASHDLQEPLRKITIFGGRLLDFPEQLRPRELDYIERMQKATQRMQKLIVALLTYSRVTTKAQPFVPVDLSQVAETTLADLAAPITQTKARIDIGSLPVIQADPLQMQQLFANLIGNALKFHRENVPPRLEISAAVDSAGWVLLRFADNGIGVEPEYTERIFTLFERLHSQSQYEGSGIGLTICKKIIERHGGSIHLESTPGVGSIFIVKLALPTDKLSPDS